MRVQLSANSKASAIKLHLALIFLLLGFAVDTRAEPALDCTAATQGFASSPFDTARSFFASGTVPSCDGGIGSIVISDGGTELSGATAISQGGGDFRSRLSSDDIEVSHDGNMQASAGAGILTGGEVSAFAETTYSSRIELSGLGGHAWTYEAWIYLESTNDSSLSFGLTGDTFASTANIPIREYRTGVFSGDSFEILLDTQASAFALATGPNGSAWYTESAFFGYTFRLIAAPVPEPSQMLSALYGLLLLSLVSRFRARTRNH